MTGDDTAPEPDVRALHQALLHLAKVTPGDINPADLEGALIALHQAGWSWKQAVMRTAKMLCAGEEPRDLRNAINDPLRLHRKATR